MTEEEKLKSSIGCGSMIMLGLICIVLLSLVGVIFPVELLPYPREMLGGIFVIGGIGLGIYLLMWRGKVKEQQREKDAKADQLLQQSHELLGGQDDPAILLAEKYRENDSHTP